MEGDNTTQRRSEDENTTVIYSCLPPVGVFKAIKRAGIASKDLEQHVLTIHEHFGNSDFIEPLALEFVGLHPCLKFHHLADF